MSERKRGQSFFAFCSPEALEGRECRERFGSSSAEVLAMRKGDWRKRMIAQRVREHTSVSLGWLATRLQMRSAGYVSRITNNLEDLADHPGWRSFRNSREKC